MGVSRANELIRARIAMRSFRGGMMINDVTTRCTERAVPPVFSPLFSPLPVIFFKRRSESTRHARAALRLVTKRRRARRELLKKLTKQCIARLSVLFNAIVERRAIISRVVLVCRLRIPGLGVLESRDRV